MRPLPLTLVLAALLPLHAAANPPAAAGHPATDAGLPQDAPSTPAAKFAEPGPGLYTGGQPDAQDLAQLHARGVRTVIDLRPASEDHGFDEAAEARRLGMTYESLPVAGKDDVTAANADALQALLHKHGEGTLVHCASGNRAGALLALGAARAGMPREEALEYGRRAGLKSLEPVVAAQLDATVPPSK